MGNCWVKISCNTQLWCLDHYNCLTAILLHILYAIDVLAYTVTGPLNFLRRRSDIYGPNYAALGRIIVGEYSKCAELINSPQKRGVYLGRAKLVESRLPENFPLFLSDEDAGGGALHAAVHNYFWDTFIPPAFERVTLDSAFCEYVGDAVREIAALKDDSDSKAKKVILRELTIKYVVHSVFGIPMSGDDGKKYVAKFYKLFFSASPTSDYVLGALRPYTTLMCCIQCSRSSLISELSDLVASSPALENYVPSEESGNLSKENYAEILVAIVGIAGCVGTSQLCYQVLDAIPTDYDINLSDKMEVTRAVLEAARMKAPVNNVNVILQNPLSLVIKGKEYTFTKGTPVAASIGLSSVDAQEFENPHTFDPERENLLSSTINFNHVGYSAVGAGKRQCPGRNIAIRLASDLLVQSRSVPESFVE